MRSAETPHNANSISLWLGLLTALVAACRTLAGFLSELHALRIDLFLHQQGLDTTTPSGKAMFQMLGVFAEFERAMTQERVRAGLARARADGALLVAQRSLKKPNAPCGRL